VELLIEELKFDITSKEFGEKLSKFVHGHQVIFWGLQKAIKENLDEHNFIHAGGDVAHLWQAAASGK